MNIFIEEHIEILKSLIKNQVDFLLIGGYAVIYYGYRRTTGDLDLWIKPSNSNKEKLIKAFSELGFEHSDLIEIGTMNFESHIVFSIGNEPQKIDFLTKINLIEFDIANQHKIIGEIDELKIPIIHLNDLILSKINTGRIKDQADIEELQRINKENFKK